MAQQKPSTAIIIAVIGALATILAACVTGFFGLLQYVVTKATEPTAAAQVGITSLSTPEALSTAAPQLTPTSAPTSRPSPTPSPGLLFATKIAADGKAIDPGSRFSANISEIYAVFPAASVPPGMLINVAEPDEEGYYAFMKVNNANTIKTVGWRWIYQGKTVNDYQVIVAPGDVIWLNFFNYNPGGIFGNDDFGPGTYKVVITLGDDPALSGDLIIEP